MRCARCGNAPDQGERFCRKCGADLENTFPAPAAQNPLASKINNQRLSPAVTKDPDELIGRGMASFFIGDGFFIVGILLSVMESSVTSLLWLLLLIPAFLFFGKGVSDVFQAKQIRRRRKQDQLESAPTSPPGNLFPATSVTERTTRQLK